VKAPLPTCPVAGLVGGNDSCFAARAYYFFVPLIAVSPSFLRVLGSGVFRGLVSDLFAFSRFSGLPATCVSSRSSC
jgi:hypothetical protein